MEEEPRPEPARGGPLDRYPLTCGVLAANLLLFLFAGYRAGGWPIDVELQLALGANEYSLMGAEPWRLLLSAFLHFHPGHFLFNAGALVLVGRPLEEELGSARLWVLYVGFALAAGLTSALYTGIRATPVASAGASGAMFGVIALGYLRARREPERLGTLRDLLRLWILLSIAAPFALSGIDLPSHMGGATAGAVAAAWIDPRPDQQPSSAWRVAAASLVVVMLVCVALMLWRLRVA